MRRSRQIVERVRGKYLKPEFPEGPFVLLTPNGVESGVYFAKDLAPTTLPGEPWGFFAGSPRIYRVTKQKGNVMTCTDGEYTIVPLPNQPNLAAL